MSQTDLIIHDEKDNVAVVVIDKTSKNQECIGWIMENDKTVKIKSINEIFLGHKIALQDFKAGDTMSEHIDLDVSKILKREMNLDQAGDALIDVTVKTANGRLTCAEALGHREFIITKLYRSA